VEVQFHACLTKALEGSEFSTSRLDRYILVEKALGTLWIGD